MSKLSHREFVTAWIEAYNKSLGNQGLAQKLNMTAEAVSAKANQLRRMGVQLPAMIRSTVSDLDVDGLNQLIEAKIK